MLTAAVLANDKANWTTQGGPLPASVLALSHPIAQVNSHTGTAGQLGQFLLGCPPTADLAALRAVIPARSRTVGYTLIHTPSTTPGGEDSRLTVSAGDRTLTIAANTHLAEKFPKWRPFLSAALATEPCQDEETHLNADYLARWTHATTGRYEPLTTWSTSPGKPLVIAAGHDFLGLQMPIRQDWDNARSTDQRQDRAALRTTWADTFNAQPIRHLNAA